MRLNRIYASEFYRTSARKDKIHAAINNPENVELVQQLSDYLNDDAQDLLRQAIKERKDAEVKEAEKAELRQAEADVNESDFPDAENNVFSPSYSGGGSSLGDFGDEGDMGGDAEEPDMFAVPEDGEEPEAAPEPDEAPVEESTNVEGAPITADTDIDDVIFDIVNESNIIKGTLNGIQDTAGVLRIATDDNELWIYYKDEVNIGDIMVDVIETLNGANYTYLTFSRLARSNNAIVFDINPNINEPVKTIKEIEEETK